MTSPATIRSALAVNLAAVVALAACTPATLTLRPEPADARVGIDGTVRGRGATTVQTPYYGTLEVSATTPMPTDNQQPAIRGTRQLVRIPPPVTGWLFPLDLLGEAVVRGFGPLQTSVQVSVPASAELTDGEEPADLEGLRQRAAAVRTGR